MKKCLFRIQPKQIPTEKMWSNLQFHSSHTQVTLFSLKTRQRYGRIVFIDFNAAKQSSIIFLMYTFRAKWYYDEKNHNIHFKKPFAEASEKEFEVSLDARNISINFMFSASDRQVPGMFHLNTAHREKFVFELFTLIAARRVRTGNETISC